MINISINQQPLTLDEHSNLIDALNAYQSQTGQVLTNIAVVHNQQIVPKSQWESHVCQSDDHFELFSAVAGG